jgi:hypothetical protein
LGVGGVGGGQFDPDVQGGLVVVAGGGQVPGRGRRVPELVVADGQVALPSGVGGVGGGQPFGDGQGGLVVVAGGAQVPGRDGNAAKLVVADGQVALPFRTSNLSICRNGRI